MNVSLTKELEQFVHDRVATGRYHSASEVVREGLRLLESREQLRELQIDEMRRRVSIGAELPPLRPPEETSPSRIRPLRPSPAAARAGAHRPVESAR